MQGEREARSIHTANLAQVLLLREYFGFHGHFAVNERLIDAWGPPEAKTLSRLVINVIYDEALLTSHVSWKNNCQNTRLRCSAASSASRHRLLFMSSGESDQAWLTLLNGRLTQTNLQQRRLLYCGRKRREGHTLCPIFTAWPIVIHALWDCVWAGSQSLISRY